MAKYEEILEDLRRLFGRKVLLSPADLAEVIAQSPAAQAVMRYRGNFPIPFSYRGRRIFISIYDLAHFLANPTDVESVKKEKPSKKSILPSSSRWANVEPIGKSLGKSLLKFQENIQRFELELDFMRQVYIEVEKIYVSGELPQAKPKTNKRPRM